MLNDLIATIETLRQRIKEHRPYFDVVRPEARTRASLIDPLLRALEWDVGDPSLVEIEPVVGPGRADYALLRGVGEPLLLLEAKKLGDTNAHHGQLASYVVGENLRRSVKIPYCAMTNGSRWQVFDVFTQECVLDASLEREHARKCALKLVGLWQPALREVGLEPVVDLGGRFPGDRSHDAHEAREPEAVPHSPGSAASQASNEVRSDSWAPLDSEGLNPSKHVRPRELRLPDGSVTTAASWRAVLVAVTRWLFDTGSLDRRDMPISVVRAKYCVSTDGRRPDGRTFKSPVFVGETGIQVEGDLTGKQIVQFAAALLVRSGQAPSDVALKLVG